MNTLHSIESYAIARKTKVDSLISNIELLAVEHASKGLPNSQEEYTTCVGNYIQAEVQSLFDFHFQETKPYTNAANTQDSKNEANMQMQTINGDIRMDHPRLKRLIAEKNNCKPSLGPINRLKVVECCMLPGSIIEGSINYPLFRHMGFSEAISMAAVVPIAVGIFFGTKNLGKYIMRARTNEQKFRRFCISLLPYAAFFTALSIPRADFFNHDFNPFASGIDAHETIGALQAGVTALISTLFVALALYLYSCYSLTDTEQRQLDDYRQKCVEVKNCEKGISIKYDEKKSIEKAVKALTTLTRSSQEDGFAEENKFKALSMQLHEVYKNTNLAYRSLPNFPECFLVQPTFQFNTYYNFLNQKPA